MISNPTPLPLRLLPGRMFLGMRGKKEGRNNIFSMEYVTGCLTNGAEWKVISGIIALLWLGEKGRNRSGSFGFSAPLPHPNKVRSFLFLQLRRFRVGKTCKNVSTVCNAKEFSGISIKFLFLENSIPSFRNEQTLEILFF